MSCAVNLLPDSCHNARRRAVRRNAWTAVVTAAGALLVCAWLVTHATDHALARLDGELGGVRARQSQLDRQLTLATITRNDLARRARALLALRQEQAVPGQLLALSSRAPGGVLFTEIRGETVVDAERFSRYRPGAPPAPSAERCGKGRHEESPSLLVDMCGYAIDHDELTRLIDVLQSAAGGPRWEQVELLRAAREPYRGGEALAFQLECRQAEDAP